VEFPQDYDFRPDLESNKDLLLDMANERSLEPLLSLVVRRLAERPPIALARIPRHSREVDHLCSAGVIQGRNA
jgi:hypothetical protein